jgi:hypothetical protein
VAKAALGGLTSRFKHLYVRNSSVTDSGELSRWGLFRLEDVKKSIWPKSKLMQNVCRRPSDRLLGILARLFLEPKFPHTNFSISSHLPVPETYQNSPVLHSPDQAISRKIHELTTYMQDPCSFAPPGTRLELALCPRSCNLLVSGP